MNNNQEEPEQFEHENNEEEQTEELIEEEEEEQKSDHNDPINMVLYCIESFIKEFMINGQLVSFYKYFFIILTICSIVGNIIGIIYVWIVIPIYNENEGYEKIFILLHNMIPFPLSLINIMTGVLSLQDILYYFINIFSIGFFVSIIIVIIMFVCAVITYPFYMVYSECTYIDNDVSDEKKNQ